MSAPSETASTSERPETADRPAVVALEGITKAFPGVVANDGVDLALRAGEVLCLLGENGAGKSTLMSILAGMYQPDEGRILVDGESVRIDSPRRALELGIGMVYQHVTLVPTLTVLENLMLGDGHNVRLDGRAAAERLGEVGRRLGVEIAPDAVVGKLSLGEQQQVEIVKALWRGSRVLILDEPTSMLTPRGIEELEKVIVQLREQGLAVVFITHKLHEAIAVGDRVAVLRRGRVVGGLTPEELHGATAEALQGRIVELMFGESASAAPPVAELEDQVEGRRMRRELPPEPLLELDGVSAGGDLAGGGVHDVSLAVRPGEILGIAGVDGNGQRELAEAIAGQRRLSAGSVRLAGREIGSLPVARRERLGLRYVTDDRLGEGSVSALPIDINVVLKRVGRPPFWRLGAIQRRRIRRAARELVERYDVRTPSELTPIGSLSGGNVQKVLLGRELSFAPRVVVFNKPTHGLDIRTTGSVRERIREMGDEGVSAVVISTELEELLALCDRIAVLYRGRVAGVLDNGPGVEREIGELMVGGARG